MFSHHAAARLLDWDADAAPRRAAFFDDLFSRGHADEEKSRYLLLASARSAREQFNKSRLYPALGTLLDRYALLEEFRDRVESAPTSSERTLVKTDLASLSLIYESHDAREKRIPAIDAILYAWQGARPHFHAALEEGAAIYDLIDQETRVEPIGIVPGQPLLLSEGYALIIHRRAYAVFQYALPSVAVHDDLYDHAFARLDLSLLETVERTSTFFAEQEAQRVLLSFRASRETTMPLFLVNPGTYADFPLDETLIPLVRRRLRASVEKLAASFDAP